MLKIRLKRAGKKLRPFYKIVVMNSLTRRDGKILADIGFYDPILKTIKVNKIILKKYLICGAYPTNTVRHLLYKTLNK